MTTLAPVPKSITKHSSTEMAVVWDNGETTLIPFVELRVQCRCAECVDEWSRQRKVTRSHIKPDIKPLAVDLVGRYAVQIRWSDGHSAGIYPFELLYSIAKGTEPT
jgi:DUF971 family protein